MCGIAAGERVEVRGVCRGELGVRVKWLSSDGRVAALSSAIVILLFPSQWSPPSTPAAPLVVSSTHHFALFSVALHHQLRAHQRAAWRPPRPRRRWRLPQPHHQSLQTPARSESAARAAPLVALLGETRTARNAALAPLLAPRAPPARLARLLHGAATIPVAPAPFPPRAPPPLPVAGAATTTAATVAATAATMRRTTGDGGGGGGRAACSTTATESSGTGAQRTTTVGASVHPHAPPHPLE